MRRREFIRLFGSAVVAWPRMVRAEQPAIPIIGFLNSASPGLFAPFVASFRQGLSEVGFVEGQNIAIEFRWADSKYDRLPALATDLVRGHVTVIAATSTPAALAAKAATSTIPIIFTTAVDPVAIGLANSLSQPGGNATGVSQYVSVLGAKRLELLRDLVPNAAMIGVLVNPDFPDASSQRKDVEEAARHLGQQVQVVDARSESDLAQAFAILVEQKAGALFVNTDAFFLSHRDQLVALAAHHAIPAIYFAREFVSAGGLFSYSPDIGDGYRQAGIYAGRILKGEKPADLPVIQPTKFELVINLKTAKALGLEVPAKLLALADGVIE